jgi:bifunctional DNA-binding transcriptional regulator/antitoxin component of YhaV-PrlF toxin-antitoxin module
MCPLQPVDISYFLPYHYFVRIKEITMTTSVLTSKYQTTVPKAVRKLLGLEIHDAIEWRVEGGKATVVPARNDFLSRRGTIAVGAGDISSDIETARSLRVEKYR